MTHPSRTRLLVSAAAFAACLLLSHPVAVSAGPQCSAAGGTCLSTGQCDQMKASTPGVTTAGTQDCDFMTEVCCIPPPAAPPPTATCDSVAGYCSVDCMDDEDKGGLDCPTKTGDVLSRCCKTKTSVEATPGAPAGTLPGGTSETATPPPSGIIPGDVANCIKTGDCSLDDIVKTGVGFANFLMGLSGALFLVIFIYGGAMYLLSFGNTSMVERGKKAVTGAVIGIVIVLSAWTIVSQIVKGITGTTGPSTGAVPAGADAKCTAKGSEWSCKTFDGATATNVQQSWISQGYECTTGLCPGDFHTVCCKMK
ncbi:pilin [Candidatus Uhrbacteria bacterium]|nr:pilin [Candidatus Uhrbacteria bacterium]